MNQVKKIKKIYTNLTVSKKGQFIKIEFQNKELNYPCSKDLWQIIQDIEKTYKINAKIIINHV